jgi:hypothetical protein
MVLNGGTHQAWGDHSVGEIVFKPKAFASHFERDVENPLGFGLDVTGV